MKFILLLASMVLASNVVQADDLNCVGCVDTQDLKKGAVTGSILAPGSVWSSRIYNNAVRGNHIKNRSITKEKLARGVVIDLQNVLYVTKNRDGDFYRVEDALNSIGYSSEKYPWLVVIGPGVYNIRETINVPEYVNIVGSGRNITKLVARIDDDPVIMMEAHSEISSLSLENKSKSKSILIESEYSGNSLKDCNLTSDGFLGAKGITSGYSSDISFTLEDSYLEVYSYRGEALGIGAPLSTSITVRNSELYVQGTNNTGVSISGSDISVFDSIIHGGTGINLHTEIIGQSETEIHNSSIFGTKAALVVDTPWEGEDRLDVRITGSHIKNFEGGAVVEFIGQGAGKAVITIASSQLGGNVINTGNVASIVRCFSSFDKNATPLNLDCSKP